METSFLAWLKGRLQELPQPLLGLGDDCGILDPATLNHGCVVTCDTVVDGIDFDTAVHSLARVGHKALAINLSDLASMAAAPVAVVVALSLPRSQPSRVASELYEGLLPLANEYGVAILGGDLTVYDGPLSITITAIGNAPARDGWRRNGALPGDRILVTGSFGGSLLGRHLDFQPRCREAIQLSHQFDVHAAIDVSDGLSLDLDRLCAASGVGAQLDLAAIPIHPDAHQRSDQSGESPLAHALSDGEDFELIMTAAEADATAILESDIGIAITDIGYCTKRTGLWTLEKGKHHRISPRGYEHGTARQ